MKIIWWNLGYPIYFKLWRKRNGVRECFFRTEYAERMRSWLINNKCATFFGCEVLTDSDSRCLFSTDDGYTDWVHSEGYAHGRVIISNKEAQKRVVNDIHHVSEWYDMGEYYIAPVHLHWSRPDIRLSQARALVRAAKSLDKPVIILGDFNIWMLFGKYFLFNDDKKAYEVLSESFVESTRAIKTTLVIPFIKLDYVFAASSIAHTLTVETLKRPISNTDHFPLMICVGD